MTTSLERELQDRLDFAHPLNLMELLPPRPSGTHPLVHGCLLHGVSKKEALGSVGWDREKARRARRTGCPARSAFRDAQHAGAIEGLERKRQRTAKEKQYGLKAGCRWAAPDGRSKRRSA